MEDVYDSALPSHKAPPGGRLSDDMLADLDRAGVLILTDFYSRERCDALKARALELVDAFDPATVRSVFSTTTQTQLDDDYFIGSGDKIRFFLEDDAFDAAGRLRQTKSDSLNKIGHAMHDLDPVFDAFSRGPELAEIGRRLGYDEPGIIQSMYIFKPPRIGGVLRLLVRDRRRDARERLHAVHPGRAQGAAQGAQLSPARRRARHRNAG